MLENIAKIHELMFGDRKMKSCQLVNIIGISKERIHEFLQLKMLCALWRSVALPPKNATAHSEGIEGITL